MIIEIKSDGHGAWNLTAKDFADSWPPVLMAYGRTRAQAEYLIRGVMTDHDAVTAGPPAAGPCCSLHNAHCEPPSELCCPACSEAKHPEHPPGVQCVIG